MFADNVIRVYNLTALSLATLIILVRYELGACSVLDGQEGNWP